MSDKLLDGYEFYKKIQGEKYDKSDKATKNTLKYFRNELGIFTDGIFHNNGFIDVPNGKGMWQNSGNFTKYMWNRYKIKGDDTNLVIYFNASTKKNEGLFISIGLIDDKVSKFEKEKSKEIYDYLKEKCLNIKCEGFENNKTDWDSGDRVFKIIDEVNYSQADYGCLFSRLKEVYIDTLNKFYNSNQNSEPKDTAKEKYKHNTEQSLNQILYGPPGTGKTYNTINKALEIILDLSENYNNLSGEEKENELVKKAKEVYENNEEEIKLKKEDDDRELLKQVFEFYKEQGQIEFVTFHQSYGYEEFVEGIKADTNDREEVIYEKKDGAFKELSELAKKNFLISNKKDGIKIDYELLINNYATYVKEKSDKDEFIDIHNSSYQLINIKEDSNENVKSFIVGRGNHTQNLAKKIILRDIENFFNEKINVYTDIEPTYKSKSSYHGNAVYYFEIYKLLKKFYKENKELYLINEDELKNYILIIDEINRGNISKIFGELITLIEPSKRIGADEEIRVNLPYSGDTEDPFGVPSNLHIIGTMNTADRSIAQIDTALRRRFVFEEMMPNPELLVFDNDKNKPLIVTENGNEININIQEIVKAINERIEYIYDREHTIGHSYFMPLIETPTKVKLDEIFKVSIIPLLAEYFYGDWGDIVEVLNDNKDYFIIDKTENMTYKTKTKRNNKVYKVQDEFSVDGYVNIYDGFFQTENQEEHQTS